MSNKIPRSLYADMYGPTKGDKVRLADTELIIEVEDDYTTYGELEASHNNPTYAIGSATYKV